MKKLIYTAALLALPAIANANYVCSGTVGNVALNQQGVLTITVGSLQNVYLCQIGATRNGISSEICKAMFAQLLSAKATGALVQFTFNDALNCTRSWTELTGWYFGPDIS